ncbi:MAG TPA: AAA family ATPase [Candidatus Paceibacterota bacterium]|nr:AAA family ATPase [Candidatus Paceibacterota bacterium]
MNIVYIMRGVPGSGKTRIARELSGRIGRIHSTDGYFYRNGKYCFDKKFLTEYHRLNFEAFCQSLKENQPIVICDNTNIRRSSYQHYIDAAQKAGYEVRIIERPHPNPKLAAANNIHGVPEAVIRRMIHHWEPSNIPTELCHRA